MTLAMRLPRSRRTRLVAASSAAAIVWSLASAAQAQDLPTNPVIVNSNGVGTAADFTYNPNLLTIDQHHDRVVIDWDDFNIGALDTVTFNQPNAGAIAFNRVDPSAFTTIDGTLNANGGVWLFSPGGLLFGSGAVVNVGSFVGTTARLDDGDIADALGTNTVTFSPLAPANGADLTVSAGADITATSGFVVLLGETIVQNGTIVSDNDAVWFGVAQGGEITFTSDGPGSPPELADGTVAAVAGQQPAFTQSNTGATTAATWVGVSNPSTTANGWSTLINLGGTIEASGIKPSTDAGVFIITGDDGVYDLTAVDTTIDGAGGLITANGGDVYIRTGQATLQDVYAEDIDVFTGGDLTLTGAIQATGDIVIGSDTLVSIESTADVDALTDVTVTTTAAGGDIYVDGDVYGYSSVVMVAHDQLTVDGIIEGVYGVYLFSTDTTAAAGSLITSNQDVYIQADGDAILDGGVYGAAIDVQVDDLASVGGVLDAGYVNIETSAGDILIGNGAQVSGTAGGFAVTMYAHTDLTIEDGATVYSVQNMRLETITGELSIGGYLDGVFIDLYGASGATVSETGYVQGNSIHLRSGGDVFMDGDLYTNNFIGIYSDADITIGQYGSVDAFSINVVADGGIVTEAGSLIDNTAGVGTVSLRAYGADGAGSVMELSGDIDAHNLQLVTTAGSVAVLDGTLTIANGLNTYVNGDFTTAAPSLIDATGDVSIDVPGDVTIAGEIRADTLTIDGSIIDTGAGYLRPDTALYVNGDEVTLGDVQLNNGLIDVNAVDSIAITGFFATPYSDIYLDTTGAGSQITLSNGMYASTLTILSAGDVTLDATADIDVTNYVNTLPGETSASITAYGDLTIVSGAQLDAQENVLLETTGPGSVLTHDGWIRAVDVDITGSAGIDIGGDISAYGDVRIDGVGDVDLGGLIYGYYVSVLSDANVTQSAGTITVEDGGLYINAAGDISTDAGASITNAVGSDNVVIELFADNSVYLDGDIHGYEVFVDSVGPMIMIGGSIYATDFIFIYNDTGSLHLTGTADLEAGTPVVSSYSSIYMGAYGSVRVDAGAQITAGVGQPGGYVSLFANGPTGYLTMSGDIASAGIYMGSRSGVVDVTVNGGLDADGMVIVTSSGALDTGAASLIQAGGDVYVDADGTMNLAGDISAANLVDIQAAGDIDLSGDIYGYEVSIVGDTDVTQSAGTITVDDGGLYIYALNDIVTEAGALIETTIDGNQGIIYLNAGHDLYLAGDIDGGYFVTINSVGIGNDTILEVSGSIYATDFIILYNDYGDIHLTGTAELFAGQPTTFGEPGIWIAAEGSILTDAGSYIHTYPGYATGYVHFEVNDVAGSIDLSGDITTENLTIEAPFGVVDIFLRDGTITTENDLTIDSNGELLVDATIYADNFYLSADGQLSVGGVLNANGDVTLNSDTGVAVTAGGQILAYDISIGTPGVTDIDGALYGQTITVGGYDGVYVSGTLDASAEVNIISLYGDVAIENGAYIRGYSSGTAVYIQADGEVSVQNGADIISYGDLMLVGGSVDFDGYAYAANFNVNAQGDIDIGVNGQVLTPGAIHLLSDDIPPVAADITIAGSLTAEDGVYIANRNDGDVVLTADAEVIAAYFMGLRLGPRGQTSLGGMDGDIYIYSAGSVITDYGSLIDATGGVGIDQGLLTIVSAGTDGASATPAAIDLSGDIVAWDVDLSATAGSIRQRTGTISFTDDFTADAAVSFIQDGGGVIDGLVGLDNANVDIDADDSILLLGVIEGYYVDLTTTGTVGGGVIQVAGEVYASDGVTIINENGDILVHSTGVIHTGTPFETSSPDIYLYAGGTITTQAGSQIYTGAGYGPGSTIEIFSTAASGTGIDLAGDISTEGDVYIHTSVADIHISGGQIYAGYGILVNSRDEVEITGGLLESPDTVVVLADSNMLLGGDIYADYIVGAVYDGEQGGEPLLRVEGELTALSDMFITNELGDVEIGSTAILSGNASGLPNYGAAAIEIRGETVTTEAGSLIQTDAATGAVIILAQGALAGTPAIDLSGDIVTDTLTLDAGLDGSIRIRDGQIDVVNALTIDVDGYFTVDDPAAIEVDSSFYASADDGVIFDGYLRAYGAVTLYSSAQDVSVGGQVNGYETILVEAGGDIALGPDAILWSDYDLAGPNTGVTLEAGGQVITAAGSEIHVGQDGATTGDVSISAHGGDLGGYSSLDLAGDIDADGLSLYTEYGSIRLRDGDIVLTEDLYIYSPRGFLMNAPATITTPGFVDIRAVDQLSVIGTIDSGEYIRLASTGVTAGGVTVSGYLYADAAVFISSADADADIVLGGPTIISDADDTGVDGLVVIDSAGAVVAPGGGVIQVGDGVGPATGDVTILADGADGASTSAIDLNLDIDALTLTLDATAGSIHIGPQADFVLANDLTADSVLDFDMDAGATIVTGGDIEITAQRDLAADGALDAAGHISLLIASVSGGDLTVGGSLTAGTSIDIANQAGDIALQDVDVIADADNTGADGSVVIAAEGTVQVDGGLIRVGDGAGPATGDVDISAQGVDAVDHAAIDLNVDIQADALSLDAPHGSIHLAGGDIVVSQDLVIDSAMDFLMDGPATITGQGDVSISAENNLVVDGQIFAGGDISLLLSAPVGQGYFTAGPGDVVVSGEVTANGSVVINSGEGGGDIYIDGTATITANDDDTGVGDYVLIHADEQVVSADGSLIRVGTTGTPSGDVTIIADGADNLDYSAIDLSGDIQAQTLILDATNGSVHLRDGDIYVLNPLTIDSGLDVLIAAAAYINAEDDVAITAGRDLTMDGEIDSAGSVSLVVSGPSGDQISIGGLIYADGEISVVNDAGDIYVGGARLIADADGANADGYLSLAAAGDLIVSGADLGVGYDGPSATGGMSLSSDGDTVIDADTWSTTLDIFAQGSIELVQGGFNTTDWVDLTAYGDISSAVGADIDAGGDVDVHAGNAIEIAGNIASQGGIDLVASGFGSLIGFTAGPGDIVVSGDLTANGTIFVGAYGGDVYLDATATLVADADSLGGTDEVYIAADGQIISAAGSSILVGASGAPTGDVHIEAQGTDNANYSAVDLSGDIEAVNALIDADGGSVNLADGAIDLAGDLEVESVQDIIQDQAASIDAGGDVYFDAEEVMTVEGSIQAGGVVDLLVDGPDAGVLTVNDLVSAGGDINVVNTNGDIVLGAQTSMFAGGDILLDAHGDLATEGFIDAAGGLTAHGEAVTIQSDIQAGAGAVFVANSDLLLDAVIIAEGSSVIQAIAGDTLEQFGQLSAGGTIQLSAYGDLTVNGDVAALGDISLLVYGGESGGDIVVSGDIASHDDITIYNQADYGDVTLTGTGSLTADIDGDGDDDAGVTIYAEGRIIAEAGSTMHVGSPTQRTGLILLGSYAYDGEGGAAIQLGGDIDAESVEIWADYGSVHVQDGSIQADESIEIYAYEDFVHDDGALIWGAQDREFQDDLSTEATLPGLLLPGVLITASDVDISGDIQSGTATDDATIVIAALNVDGDVTLGGADNGLSTGFTLSDAEFQNLIADRIVLLAGTGPDAPDLIVSNLSIDAANTSDVWLGTTGSVFVEGAVTPTQPGEVDLHIGFTVLTQGLDLDLTALSPGQILVDFIPTDVHISGSLGSVSNPFGHVTLIANGDILMGSSAFMVAAENDPEFDAFEESENFDSPGEGHVFIAADILQMAATGEILQQDTVEGPGFGGLVLGQPQAGYELIFSPDDIEGQPIGFGTDQWTANFNAGPTRIELFGQFNGTPHAVTGTEAARLDHLLDPDILLGDYEFNTCLFGGTGCQTGNETPPFQNPTPPVHPDPAEIPGVEEAVNFFNTFPFQEPDEEDEEERIEGEPVTGSGNEDLWPVTTQGGTRP